MMLTVQALRTGYGRIPILNGISFAVNQGEFIGILGHNGMGKTTLLKALMGFLPATGGLVRFDGDDVTAAEPYRRARLGMGYVPQGREIFPGLSVYDNLRMGCSKQAGAERDTIAAVLEEFPRLEPLLDRPGGALSGGEQQLLAMARCLCGKPRLILLDEPMAGMNFEEKEDMARYIVDLNEEFGMTVMMIEHDMGVVMDISHRVMVLDFGRKIAEGDPASVLADPHVKRAYLGEEDEVLVDPDDTPATTESAA